jgi:phage terminase small subunit
MLSDYEIKAVGSTAAGLNEKQQIFVEEYVKTNNATQSAIAAGYSDKHANRYGHSLLQHKGIKNAIDELRKQQDLYMQAQFRAGAAEAFECLMEIVRDKEGNPQHRVAASKDLLDRAGFKAAIKTESSIEVSYLESTDQLNTKLENAFNALDESRAAETDIIPAD